MTSPRYVISAEDTVRYIEQSLPHAQPPIGADYETPAQWVVAEIEFARAWGLAVGLVQAGFVDVPFGYSIDDALRAAERTCRQMLAEAGA
jgi:hypothetical protein